MRPMTHTLLALTFLTGVAAAQLPGNGTDLVPVLEVNAPPPLLVFSYPVSFVIDTDLTPMPMRVRIFRIESGATVTVRGSRPFHVVADEDISILGTLDASGLDGNAGGAGGPAGFSGGAPGLAGSGPAPGAPGGGGGGTVVPGPFGSHLVPGSGGGGSAATGGGGGGVVRLHAGRTLLVTGRIAACGGAGGDAGASVVDGAGAGSGGTVEMVAPQVSVPQSVVCPTCGVTVAGGVGGSGSVTAGGNGADGRVIVRSDGFVGAANVTPAPTVFPYGATMTPTDPITRLSIRPDAAELPALVGAQAFVLCSGLTLPPGQRIPLGAGDLLLDPTDALFDPLTSPVYPFLLGQGGTLVPGADRVDVTVDFTPLVPALAALGLQEFSIFTQALLVANGAVVDASDVATLDYLADSD